MHKLKLMYYICLARELFRYIKFSYIIIVHHFFSPNDLLPDYLGYRRLYNIL